MAFQSQLLHTAKNHQHPSLNSNLFLEISILMTILLDNESFLSKTTITT